ncbi:MAG: ATP-dependent DNA ligase, partial [Pseudomonadota bacterium]
MKPFANLLDRLTLTPSRNAKIRLMVDYFTAQPDPERGWGLAAITRDLDIASVKPAMLRAMVEGRMDPILFRLSHDYVGDLAETIALVWDADRRTAGVVDKHTDDPAFPAKDKNVSRGVGDNAPPLLLSEVVSTLNTLGKARAVGQVSDWLEDLDASGRYALLKLATGALRIGVTARLAKQALVVFAAEHGQDVDIVEIEELWHGLEAPYEDLFAWLTGAGEKPAHLAASPFRPVMLASPLAQSDMEKLD